MNNVANNVFILFAYPIECPLIHECLLGGRKVETDSLAEDGKGFGWMFWVGIQQQLLIEHFAKRLTELTQICWMDV